jgi:hypothetical protein
VLKGVVHINILTNEPLRAISSMHNRMQIMEIFLNKRQKVSVDRLNLRL